MTQVHQAGSDSNSGKIGGAPVLWHLKVSHYNEKARWALDHKRVPHVRRAAAPGRHRAIAQRLTGARTFPVLVLDGEAIGDSTRIIEALERRYPESPLYPADPEARRRALLIEDFFDEELGPHLRLLVISQMLPSGKLILGAFFPDLGNRRRLAARAMFPLHRRRVIAAFGIDDASVELAWAKVRAAGERFRAELQPSGYLVGDRFTVADLTVAALLARRSRRSSSRIRSPSADIRCLRSYATRSPRRASSNGHTGCTPGTGGTRPRSDTDRALHRGASALRQRADVLSQAVAHRASQTPGRARTE